MATTLSSIKLVQRLSANVQGVDSGGGIQGSIPIGGTNNTALTTTDADLMYSFDVTWSSAQAVTWTLQTGAVTTTGSNAVITGLQGGGGGGGGSTSYDVNGVALPNAVTIVAIYFETASTNVGNVTIEGTADNWGDFLFNGNDSKSRSVLLVPKTAHGSGYYTLNATGAAKLKAVCLAKD